jgi:hypothetical protein
LQKISCADGIDLHSEGESAWQKECQRSGDQCRGSWRKALFFMNSSAEKLGQSDGSIAHFG